MSDGLLSIRLRRRSVGRGFSRVRRGAVALLMAVAAPVWSAYNDSDCLYRPFDIPAGEAWTSHAIELTARDWRIGNPHGGPVDEAGMKRHLAEAGRLLVGGVCTGAREGETFRACGFALAEPRLAGRRYDDPRWAWQSTTGTSLVSVMDAGYAVITAFSVPEADSVDEAPADFVGMRAPPVLVRALRKAYGAPLSFSLRAVPNPLVAPPSGASDGLVVMCSDREGSSAALRTPGPVAASSL